MTSMIARRPVTNCDADTDSAKPNYGASPPLSPVSEDAEETPTEDTEEPVSRDTLSCCVA